MPKRNERDGLNWRPGATLATLEARAELLASVRAYFALRGVLETTVPVCAPYGSTDPNVQGFVCGVRRGTEVEPAGFLQTSPEFALKRLVAAYGRDVYALTPAFRQGEHGRLHRAEFTLLEWYRRGFDHHQLMDDVEALVRAVVPALEFRRASYQDLFVSATGLDPHRSALAELQGCAGQFGYTAPGDTDQAELLDFLFDAAVSRGSAADGAVFVYDFPRCQAAYARLDDSDPPRAARFELLINGLEIANGYHEVTDAAEQRARQEEERQRAAARDFEVNAIDPRLLAALAAGLPDCAGVALGIDRLLMVALGLDDIGRVVPIDEIESVL